MRRKELSITTGMWTPFLRILSHITRMAARRAEKMAAPLLMLKLRRKVLISQRLARLKRFNLCHLYHQDLQAGTSEEVVLLVVILSPTIL
jgi:hypothetical protein